MYRTCALCNIQIYSTQVQYHTLQDTLRIIQSTSLQHLYVQMHFLNLPTEDTK